MSETGSLKVQVYTARRAVPLKGAAVTVKDMSGEFPILIAFRKTGEDGSTEPIIIETPDRSDSLEPAMNHKPFSAVDVQVDYPQYYSIAVKNVQVFSGMESLQEVDMIPLSEYADPLKSEMTYDVNSQNL